eukprot:TRINITY_DN6226_c0_g1_i1.p1 TRINITY_DN6226_c0_g1~~TRINITY_DN6226_c0_g1_i1.p1  ORF type:complete len:479 (-),score=114.46 TRINITY_DN6226_c0_g1_i1:54-1382(-)
MNELKQEKEVFVPINPPRCLVPKKMNSQLLDFSDLPSLEVARQLTLLEFEIFRSIKPRELLRKSWMKPNKEDLAPNVISLIQRFNTVSFWICYEIVKFPDLTRRSSMLCKFINLCEELKTLRNIHGMMVVISALNNSSVTRLKQTWKEVPPKTLSLMKEHETLVSQDSNYKNYRQYISEQSPPFFPFEGVFLTDLTFIDENEDYREEGYLNWEKMTLLGTVLLGIQTAQKSNYNLESVAPLQQFLRNGLISLDENQIYKLSRQNEPPVIPSNTIISQANFSHSSSNLSTPERSGSLLSSSQTNLTTINHPHSHSLNNNTSSGGSCIVKSGSGTGRLHKPSNSNPILVPVATGSLDLSSSPPSPNLLSSGSPPSSPFYSPLGTSPPTFVKTPSSNSPIRGSMSLSGSPPSLRSSSTLLRSLPISKLPQSDSPSHSPKANHGQQ